MDWRELLYPELKEIPVAQRDSALAKARDTEFDWLEKIGILASVVAASAIVGKFPVPALPSERFLSTLLLYFISIPLLAATAGVFMTRRTRRGLREAREKKDGK